MTDSMDDDAVGVALRELIAEVTDLDPATVRALPPQTRLLAGELGLNSVQGARLLVRVRDRFGVDVAAEDLALRSLESLGTLQKFIHDRRPQTPTSG